MCQLQSGSLCCQILAFSKSLSTIYSRFPVKSSIMLTKWKLLFYFLLLAILGVGLFPGSILNNLPVQAQTTINYKFIWPKGVTTLEQKIYSACELFGCNPKQLIKVVQCESGGRNIIGTWGHIGIFQYTRGTWAAFSKQAGVPGADIWSVDAAVYVTGDAFGRGLSWHWSCAK